MDHEDEPSVEQFLDSLTPSQQEDLLHRLLSQRTQRIYDAIPQQKQPTLHPVPAAVASFQFRVDLLGVKPPIWRRLIVPGDLYLDQLHVVLQAAMGWSDSHLHRFRTAAGPGAPAFLNPFDVAEGEFGIAETEVRLDQVVAAKGDCLWYDYDFGDDWQHRLKIEAVLAEPADGVEVVTGRRACPPEDVGGVWGYEMVARWVESGYDPALLPDHFDDAQQAIDWLPPQWNPATFDPDLAHAWVTMALADATPRR